MFSKFLDLCGLENLRRCFGILWPYHDRWNERVDVAMVRTAPIAMSVSGPRWDGDVESSMLANWPSTFEFFRCGKKRVWDFTVEIQQRRRFQLLEMEKPSVFLKSTTRNLSKNRRWILYFKILLICEANETLWKLHNKMPGKNSTASRADWLASAQQRLTGNGARLCAFMSFLYCNHIIFLYIYKHIYIFDNHGFSY